MSKERLVELIGNAPIGVNGITLLDKHEPKVIEEIADYILADRWIRLPCDVGDVVYVVTSKIPCYACKNCSDFCHKDCCFEDKNKQVVKRATVCSIEIEKTVEIKVEIEGTKTTSAYNYIYWREDIGDTVFLTREEAEAKLREVSE